MLSSASAPASVLDGYWEGVEVAIISWAHSVLLRIVNHIVGIAFDDVDPTNPIKVALTELALFPLFSLAFV